MLSIINIFEQKLVKKLPLKITSQFLRKNPDYIFVFGDNIIRKGYGGAASLRDEPNTYGFITKKHPDNRNESFYRVKEYSSIFDREFKKLKKTIGKSLNKTFLISKLGAGLANKYNIYEKIIEPRLWELEGFNNVILLNFTLKTMES